MEPNMNLLLIDGTNIVMRYAFAQLGERQTHPDAMDIERVCGSVEWAIFKVSQKFSATHAIICYDSEGETWRKAIYPDYKKSRPPGTSAWSKRSCDWMTEREWKCAAVSTFEGDDVVATLATRAHAGGHDVTVFSGDHDLLQLIDVARIVQFGGKDESKYVVRGEVFLADKYKVEGPAEYTIWKALVGDSGDEIPGCKRIGPVNAGKMIARHGSDIEALLGAEINIDEEQFRLMLQLVSLRTDVPIEPIRPADCRVPAMKGER
jgi:DNA polymerase-1